MEQMYKNKMNELGYNQLVCNIFADWENVKDEILIPERKSGSGNGTIHIFLGAADYELRQEFSSYYSAVENGEDPAISAVKITHYFLPSNVISMLGYVCQYCYTENQNIGEHAREILESLLHIPMQNGLLSSTSLFKLSLGSNKLRPYFKQFNNDGAFTQIIRKVLLPESSYKISLYKNYNNEYAAFWLLGFDSLSNFEADSNKAHFEDTQKDCVSASLPITSLYRPYLTAIKSKPFLLLAGISGTGKSRIVRELAFMSCPKYLQDKDGVTPGNYCMIEVKPNWHDSTELLGYYSNISKGYQFKKFVKFLVKAKMHPEVPFFVCMDEMNLAPVEQYFAEILSILETRKHPKAENGVDMDTIKTEVLVEPQHFRNLGIMDGTKDTTTGKPYVQSLTDREIYLKLFDLDTESNIDPEVGSRDKLSTIGLSLPDNVIIIGTVNMDETTHQFSRKVIDRAMTIEMNGGRLANMFGGSRKLEYLPEEQQQKWQAAFRQRYVCADEVLELHPEVADDIRTKLPTRLDEINKALRGTPFEVSYRVLNELTIMVGVMLDDNAEEKDIDTIINEAIDNILLMKILPRVEGDSDMFELSAMEKKRHGVEHDNRLKWLLTLAPEITITEEEGANHRQTAKEKIQEMIDRLDSHEFTRYWP